MKEWLSDLWTRITFLFKPTHRVFSSIQDAMDGLPARGGTLLVGPGEFVIGPEGVQVPSKDIRIIGGVYRMVPGSEGFKVRAAGKRVIFVGCSFIGNGTGSAFTEEN